MQPDECVPSPDKFEEHSDQCASCIMSPSDMDRLWEDRLHLSTDIGEKGWKEEGLGEDGHEDAIERYDEFGFDESGLDRSGRNSRGIFHEIEDEEMLRDLGYSSLRAFTKIVLKMIKDQIPRLANVEIAP